MPEADLEELEQDVRLKLWQSLSARPEDQADGVERFFDKPASFIRKVVLSVSIDAARRRQVRGSEHAHISIGDIEIADNLSAEVLELKGELAGLLKQLKAQAPESASALGLYLQGFTTDEVGNLLGWTEAKARNTIYRFLEQIRSNNAGHSNS